MNAKEIHQKLNSFPTFHDLSRSKQKLIFEAVENGFTASQFNTFAITLEKPGHDGLRFFSNRQTCNLLLLRTRKGNKNIRNIRDIRAFIGLQTP